MAELRTQDNSLFYTGLNKDEETSFLKEGEYTHAINMFPQAVASEAHAHAVANEPSTFRCANFPYDLVGSIPLEDEVHAVFLTNDIDSEIGLFDEKHCTYTKVVNDTCLGFKKSNLIKGAARRDSSCQIRIYWNDGINPTRTLNIDDIPYTYTLKPVRNGCPVKEFTNKLDCTSLLLNPNVGVPSTELSQTVGGSLGNGSYRVAIRYSVNSIPVSDVVWISDVEPVFSKQNLGKAIRVKINDLDQNFDEYELILISNINQQTTAERVGFYPISQDVVVISTARQDNRITIPLSELVLITPFYYKGEDMFTVGDYLLQIGISIRPGLNYQSQANNIKVKYAAYKVPQDYYRKGGSKVGYMRDEQYALFVRWVYTSGKRSDWYSIPGREAVDGEDSPYSSQDAWEVITGNGTTQTRKFEIINTADFLNYSNMPLKEGLIGTGKMGYWESTETYPDSPVWGNLACKPIRHHKFPDCEKAHIHPQGGNGLILLGFQLSNIEHPKDEDGNPVRDIVAFEVGRSNRKGNMTVISKGMINNAGTYVDPSSGQQTLYTNYPYNDLRTDPFLSSTKVSGGTSGGGYSPFGTFRNDIYSFHSPNVQFNKLQLGQELKIETEEYGIATGRFDEVYKHPKHKLIRDFALLVASLVGVGEGLIAISGNKCTTYESGKPLNIGVAGVTNSVPGSAAVVGGQQTTQAATDQLQNALGAGSIGSLLGSNAYAQASQDNLKNTGTQGYIGASVTTTVCAAATGKLPKALALANSVFLFAYYFGRGTEQALDIVKRLVPFQQYAIQYDSHGFYNNYNLVPYGNRRRFIENYSYVSNSTQTFTAGTETLDVNNIDRPTSILLKVNMDLTRPIIQDQSRVLLSQSGGKEATTSTPISAYYASIKNPLPGQYGQIDSIEVEHTSYIQKVDYTTLTEGERYSTDTIFGGDTYINRYTEKKIMPYFTQSMYDVENGYELDYTQYYNIPYARFWINTQEYDLSEIINIPPALPNDKHSLDNNNGKGRSGTFVIKNGYFYLYNNGVLDFFCESDINVDDRNWGEPLSEKFYDPYEFANTQLLFRSDVIKADNSFFYDKSLSRNEQLNLTNGLIQSRNYDPALEDCYSHLRNVIIYSLPQQQELRRDNWRVFLANNYYKFSTDKGNLVAAKSINKTGVIFLFEDGNPMMFQGVDTLRTDLDTKVTIGDGGLFAQAPQNVINSDYVLAPCQSRWGNINTEFGLYFVSQSVGKVFCFTGQLEEISMYGMSSWFRQYLPSKLLLDFPEFELADNQVVGVGINMAFDSTYKILYVTKKDWSLKAQYQGEVVYQDGVFKYQGLQIELGNPVYFEDASWTISYNPLTKRWISFHEWHPDWVIQTNQHFITVKEGYFWKHNQERESFCVFYGTIYPWEIEVPLLGKQVETLASIELNSEVYKYFNNDFFHVLDFFFDEAIIHNSEQISGVLKLNPPDRNRYVNNTPYPFVGLNRIETVYSKEEQKYRLNQFWDITNYRGEFQKVERRMWITSPNGYSREINLLYVDYSKKMVERKPFRHYYNKLVLRRTSSEDKNMILKWLVSKKVISLR